MPRVIQSDYQRTRDYTPILYEYPNTPQHLIVPFRRVERRYIHEDHVVDPHFVAQDHIDNMFSTTHFDYLYMINEPICPRFILELYSRVSLVYDEDRYLFIQFRIQDQQIIIHFKFCSNS